MSVEYTRPALIQAETLLYSKKEVVDALALMAIVSMIEANIDMICDMPDEYPTKNDIEAVMNGAAEQSIDYLNDAMDELKEAVIRRVREGKLAVRVKSMKFCDVDGMLDDVTVNVNFE